MKRGRKPQLKVVSAEDVGPVRAPKTRGPILPGINVTAKEEAFAQAVVKGASLSDAYRQSHDASNMTAETLWRQAIKINSRDRVRARIDSLIQAQERETLHDSRRAKDWIFRNLQRIVENGESEGAQVAALQVVAKMHALLTDKVEQTTEDAATTAELRQQLADALATLANPPRLRA